MTAEERDKCRNAVVFFIKQHDEISTCTDSFDTCSCTFAGTVRDIKAWWVEKLRHEDTGRGLNG